MEPGFARTCRGERLSWRYREAVCRRCRLPRRNRGSCGTFRYRSRLSSSARRWADDLNLVTDFDAAALVTARGNCAAAGDRKDVLDGHQEREISLRSGVGMLLSTASMRSQMHFVFRGVRIGAVAGQCVQALPRMIGRSSPGYSYLRAARESPSQRDRGLFVVDLVALVHEGDDRAR